MAHPGDIPSTRRALAGPPAMGPFHTRLLEIGRYGRVEARPDWSRPMGAGRHEPHTLHLAIAGSATLTWDDRRLALEPGGMYWMPGMWRFARHCAGSYDHIFLGFSCEFVPGVDLLSSWCDAVRIGTWDPDRDAEMFTPGVLSAPSAWLLRSLVEQCILQLPLF